MKLLHPLLLTMLVALSTACRAEDGFSGKLSTDESPPTAKVLMADSPTS